MSSFVPDHHEIRFGEFRLDPKTGELCNNGHRCILQGKPLQLLIALLERPGGLLTREELRTRLWEPNTFVDFDLSLNKAVNRLREALGDSADKPRFIETLPRRGYRFNVTVEKVPALPFAPSAPPHPEPPAPVLLPSEGEKTQVAPVVSSHQRMRKTAVLAVCITLLILACLSLAWWRWTATPDVSLIKVTQLTNDGRTKRGPLLANGGLLYYNQMLGETWEVEETSAVGGTSVAVPGTKGFCLTDISADGSQLLVGPYSHKNSPIYSLVLPAGVRRRIGDIEVLDASWSPDGEKLAFSSGADLFVANRDGKDARKIATAVGPVSPIRWSPDGQILRFTVSDMKADRLSIWEVKKDGAGLRSKFGELRPLTGEWGACCGNWTPDSTYYIFQSDHDGGESLWAAKEGRWPLSWSTRPVRLTSGPQRIVASVPSRDGKTLYAIGLLQRGEVMRYDSHAERFVPYLTGLSAVQLNFSRDGHWLTYISFPDRMLWRCKSNGEDCMQLTFPPMVAAWPQWSPDGKQIVFSGQVRGDPFHVFTISAQGGIPRQLTHGGQDELPASWSPDGNEIIYGTPSNLQGKTSIYHLNLTTESVTVLPGSRESLRFPQWSPDGKYIAAIDDDGLLLFESSTQNWENLDHHSARQPNWSPDGQYLYFVSSEHSEPMVYRLRIADRKLEEVASLASLKWRSYGNFSWMGPAPDGSLLIFQDVSTSEIYSFHWQQP